MVIEGISENVKLAVQVQALGGKALIVRGIWTPRSVVHKTI